jgi:DeoR/GlpR family transcriptional regulator of sugar metabolism
MSDLTKKPEVSVGTHQTGTTTRRRKLNKHDVAKIVKSWGQKSVEELANELGVATNTVRSMVYELRKLDPTLCPKTQKTTRADIARAALELLKSEDQVTDMM